MINEIKKYTDKWKEQGQWSEPDLGMAILFMVTEAGEALDAYIRMSHPEYYRTHPSESESESDLLYELYLELGQVIKMAFIALDKMYPGTDPLDAVRAALRKRDG